MDKKVLVRITAEVDERIPNNEVADFILDAIEEKQEASEGKFEYTAFIMLTFNRYDSY